MKSSLSTVSCQPYTKKQWDKWPAELDASVLARLPVRSNRDDKYFDDKFQALPADGYTTMFEKMLLNNDDITVRLSVDYFQVKSQLPKHKLLVFTGPIDAYFASQGWSCQNDSISIFNIHPVRSGKVGVQINIF